eukprot:gene42951-52486_t
MDFMKRLLTRDIKARISTADALAHPFITGQSLYPRYNGVGPADGAVDAASESVAPAKLAQVLESMVFFVRTDALTRLLCNMISHTLGPTDLQQFREEFTRMDKTFLGSLSRRDFLAAFSGVEQLLPPPLTLRALFDQLTNGNAYLTYHEYVAGAMHNRVHVTEARLSLVFSYLDPENKGVLTLSGVQSALGEEVSARAVEEMLESCGGGRDRAVTKNDLFNTWYRVWGRSADTGIASGADYMDISPSPSGKHK